MRSIGKDLDKFVLGIDTSNYTTSVSLFNINSKEIIYRRKLLPVKKGESGIRQSDAVFCHIKQLPIVIKDLINEKKCDIICIGATNKPRNIKNSYMPCFLPGESAAEIISTMLGVPVFKTSHQINHILSAIYSSGQYELLKKKEFAAFHVSGGTTDCVKVYTDPEYVLKTEEYSSSLDLKAGQAIDRIGIKLGLDFPCGIALEKIAQGSKTVFKEKIKLKGRNCCLSGLENKCSDMLDKGADKSDIAKYCLYYIAQTIAEMTKVLRSENNDIPVIYAGGVMSDRYIQNRLNESFDNVYFSEPEFSSDNAVGSALYGYLKYKEIGG